MPTQIPFSESYISLLKDLYENDIYKIIYANSILLEYLEEGELNDQTI